MEAAKETAVAAEERHLYLHLRSSYQTHLVAEAAKEMVAAAEAHLHFQSLVSDFLRSAACPCP